MTKKIINLYGEEQFSQLKFIISNFKGKFEINCHFSEKYRKLNNLGLIAIDPEGIEDDKDFILFKENKKVLVIKPKSYSVMDKNGSKRVSKEQITKVLNHKEFNLILGDNKELNIKFLNSLLN